MHNLEKRYLYIRIFSCKVIILKTDNEKKDLFIYIGSISLLADLVTLGQFIISKSVLDVWSGKWLISIFIIIFLMSAGLTLLSFSGEKELAKKVLPLFSGLYGTVSAVSYVIFGGYFALKTSYFSEFTGFILIFLIMSSVSIITAYMYQREYLKNISYLFAVANVLFVMMLVYKYFFSGSSISFFGFIGEVLILALGAFIFIILYYESENDFWL